MRKAKKIDRKQTKLADDRPLTTKIVLDSLTVYRCPFCLFEGHFYQFRVKLKEGISEKSAQCPECGNKMRMSSLTQDLTPAQFGKWLYDYVVDGGYSKIRWEKLTRRLKEMGIANEFWEGWRKAKEDWHIEKYGRSTEETEKAWEEYHAGEIKDA